MTKKHSISIRVFLEEFFVKFFGERFFKIEFFKKLFLGNFLFLLFFVLPSKTCFSKINTDENSSDRNNSNKNFSQQKKSSNSENFSEIYQFSFKKFDGSDLKLSDFKNKVILMVNTASKCGFTGQYAGFENIHKKYSSRGLVIIAVPSNDFGSQEPANNEEIQRFCKYNYGVSFLVAQKEIVSGENAHPFYKYAKKQLGDSSAPKWNFHKYLISKNGKLVDYFISTTAPESAKLTQVIESELEK